MWYPEGSAERKREGLKPHFSVWEDSDMTGRVTLLPEFAEAGLSATERERYDELREECPSLDGHIHPVSFEWALQPDTKVTLDDAWELHNYRTIEGDRQLLKHQVNELGSVMAATYLSPLLDTLSKAVRFVRGGA